MTVDAARRPYRPSLPVTARTLFAVLATTVALAALATLTVGCAPPRDTGAPTPAPTLAVGPPSEASRRS
jgi:hypothetical protein